MCSEMFFCDKTVQFAVLFKEFLVKFFTQSLNHFNDHFKLTRSYIDNLKTHFKLTF